MTTRRRWLLVPLALMILLSTGLRSGAAIGNSSNQRGLMADLIRFYQIYDRMSDENWTNFVKANRDEIAKKFTPPQGSKLMPGTVPSKVRKNIPGNAGFSRRAARQPEPFNHMFFDPDNQRKMGGSEDTYECIVSLQGDDAALQQAGARIISSLPYKGGRIARVAVAGKQLAAVAGLPVVRKMAPVMKREVDNDLGSIATGAARLRVGTAGNWDTDKGFTGQGVVVGLIDTGIDWSHADFNDPVNGGTRIQYIWNVSDDSDSSKTPAALFGGDLSGLTFGRVWTKAEIDGGSCTSYDTNGHGTHTSGTAAGNGGATGNYTGMAPNADIIMVQGLTNNGILFIYEMAKRLGKPCAVNMSYGPTFPVHYETAWPDDFPQDSTDLDGQWIDALNQYYGAGNIPVKSAGNIGHWNTYTNLSGNYPKKLGGYHWGTNMGAKSSHTLNVPDYDALWNDWFGYSPGYHDVPELYFGAWLERPADVLITDPYGDTYVFPFGEDQAYVTDDGNVIVGEIYSTPETNGAYTAVFEIFPYYGYYGATGAAVQPTMGKWNFSVAPKTKGKGNADFWVSDLNWYDGDEYFGIDWSTPEIYTTFAGPNSHSSYIVDEGSTPFEITVGAWTTRTNWDSINGHNYTYTEKPILSTIADFSSPGPARSRLMKPDIAAPGQIILSALTNDTSVNAAYVTTDGEHQAMSGTSMSAPFTTGGIALVLQKSPNYSLSQVRDFLKTSAIKDSFTINIGRNGFGAGKFCVRELKRTPVAVLTVDKKVLVLSTKQIATFNGQGSYDPDGLPFTLKWVLVSAPAGAVCKLTPIEYSKTATLVPDPKIVGTYTVGLVAVGSSINSVMAVVKVQTVK